MTHRTVFLSACGITLLLSSCSIGRMTAKWAENQIDGPWTAPGVHAREFHREYFRGIMDAGVTGDTVWTTATGSRRDAYRIAESVSRHLEKLGYFDRWPESQSISDGYRQRVAPFTFHIVAINPTVVIMAPHDFGNPKGNRSARNIIGDAPKQAFGSRYMLNWIGYGTTLPYHPGILWFSPDIGTAPAALTGLSDLEQEIVHKRIHLVVKREGDVWTTRRH